MAKKKYTHELVSNYFRKYGCELLKEYIDVKSSLEYKCKCGRKVKTTFDTYRRSKHKKCKVCIGEQNNANSIINLEFVKNYFKEFGCELLEKEYKNSKTKMKYICLCGEIDFKDWNHFNAGQRCKKCAIRNNADKQKRDIAIIINTLAQYGFEYLENHYKNSKQKLKLKCSCGEIVYKSYSTVLSSPKCTCKSKYKTKSTTYKRYTKEELIRVFWDYVDKYGTYPNSIDFKNNQDYPDPSSYQRVWGSWKNFMIDINVISEDGWYKQDEEVLIKLYEYEPDKTKIINALVKPKRWNTISHKAGKMGLKRSYEVTYFTKDYTKEEIINGLKQYYAVYNETPTMKKMEMIFGFNGSIFRRKFGNFNNALRKAGIDVKYDRKPKNIDINQFKMDYYNGMPIKELAKKYGYSDPADIYYNINKYGINKNRNHRWTDSQVELLIKYYPTEDWDCLLKILKPFNRQAIHTKASDLKIERMKDYLWTDEEIKILNKYYEDHSVEYVQSMIPHRTISAISAKAQKLGLKNREIWSDEEINKLKELYPIMTNLELLKFFPNRTINSISSMATMKFNLNKSVEYRTRLQEKTKKELLDKLKKFADELGRTPTANDINRNDDMPGFVSYNRYFGSYADACKEIGLTPNVSMFGKSYNFVDKNGEMCRSSKELIISNILIDNKVSFEKEILYKDIIDGYDEDLIKCDWFIENEILVEYFGMMDKEYYAERAKRKINICEEFGILFIDIYPSDLDNNYNGLINKFNNQGINLEIFEEVI